jgi:hypothetical protein
VPATKPRVRDDLAVVELEGEAVIYDEVGENLHHLNPTATIIFSLCDGSATIIELAEDVSEAFSIPRDQVERQIRDIVHEFKEAGLLEERRASIR